mgnify:CR=1 FL=1
MKEKKVHEVLQICPFLHSIWKSHHVNTIVDIGAGQGYISEVHVVVNTKSSFSLESISTR